MSQPVSAIVIPAYNEATTIRVLVERCLQLSLPVIVVDDGSSDNTVSELANLPITLIRNEQNSGKAAALWRGMQCAVAEGIQQVISIDGDGQHRPEDIPSVLECAGRYPDNIIIAARMNDNEQAPRARLAANRFADFWISWAAGQWIHDTQSGFRLYPVSLITQLTPDTRRKKGFVFESQILIEAAQRGISTQTTPISSIYHTNTRASHFRPVEDITRIVLMVAWSLISRAFYPSGLWNALKSRAGK